VRYNKLLEIAIRMNVSVRRAFAMRIKTASLRFTLSIVDRVMLYTLSTRSSDCYREQRRYGRRQAHNGTILLFTQPCCCCFLFHASTPRPNSTDRLLGTFRCFARPSSLPAAIRRVIHSTISGPTSRDCPVCTVPG